MQYDFIINKNNFKNHKLLLALMLEKINISRLII